MVKFEINWNGKIYDCEWYDQTNFEDLKNVLGVAGFIFDKNLKLCIVKLTNKDVWTIPGGHPEKEDGSFEDTLMREVDEEADLDIKNLQRVGFIKIVPRENPKDIFYQLRYIARVERVKKQTIDPAEGEILQRKFIDPKDFEKYAKWGYNGEFQLGRALKKLKEK